MAKSKNTASRTAVWVIVGLLILAMGGFGVDGVLNSASGRIAQVGEKDVSANEYARALQQQFAEITRQTGQPYGMARARQDGVDQAILNSLIRQRALDHEASQLGLSIGDENLRDQIVQIQSFRGIDGSFDREGYAFALQNAGLSEAQFETQLREETARTILTAAIEGGVQMPAIYGETLVGFVGETRDFTWARLHADLLDTPVAEPAEDALRSFHAENIESYQIPETKRITYALLTPLDVIGTLDIPEEDLRREYDARADEFSQPERRLVERLVYLDADAAEAARAQIDAGNTFEGLVEARGLSLTDVDLGDVTRDDLGAAADAVFAAELGAVVGPLDSELGPALFRVNALLPAQVTSFDDARSALRDRLAADRAQRQLDVDAEAFEDMLAGGASLEELAQDTPMRLGQIDWYDGQTGEIAAYLAFQRAAATLSEDDFPRIQPLDDGGIFAMRLDETTPQRDAAFDEVADQVRADWTEERTEEALRALSETMIARLEAGETMAALGLTETVETGMTRGAFLADAPQGFIPETVFDMAPGETRSVTDAGTAILVRLDAVTSAFEDPASVDLQARLLDEVSASLADSLSEIVTSDALLRANPSIDARALDAVHTQFP